MFGRGVMYVGLDQLFIQDDGVTLAEGNGNQFWYDDLGRGTRLVSHKHCTQPLALTPHSLALGACSAALGGSDVKPACNCSAPGLG